MPRSCFRLGTSLALYASNSDDTLCQTSWEGTITPNPINPGDTYQIHWTYLLNPYVKNWQIFLCPSDSDPQVPKNPCASLSDIGKLNASGLMYCDWMVPKYSYIPNYNLMPAHDWLPVSLTALESPADVISLTERRNKLKNGTVMGRHKGVSGFNPSQPCPAWTRVDYTGNGSPATGTFSYWNVTQANYHLGVDTNDKNDIVCVKWDQHTSGQNANYIYSDGHAKTTGLGDILNRASYKFGDKWYPTPMPGNKACP